MAEIKVFPTSRRHRAIGHLVEELHRLNDGRRMSRWRSEMERFCQRLDDMGVSETERRRQVSDFSTAVEQALRSRVAQAATPDDAA